jgi:soluble lytic murein transglycosylase-like protein
MVGRKQIPSTKFNRMRQIIAQMLCNAYGGEGLFKGKAMPMPRRAALSLLLTLPLVACGRRQSEESAPVSRDGLNPGETPEMRALIRKYAGIHGIPESLLHRVIQRESDYNPRARNGPYYGLMQILPQTAGTMGYRGAPDGLLDAETNLQYAGRYLRGAWLVSDRSETEAVGWYARGYYYEAKRRGLLKETGLRT